MKDYYGNEYVESGWWWPFSYWANRTQARSAAISVWLRRVCSEIKTRFQDAEIKITSRAIGAGDIVWTSVKIRIRSVGGLHVVGLDGVDYDTMTKAGIDPVEAVRLQLAGQRWLTDHGRKAPDYAADWED